jgi:hypothetical protein
MNGFETLEATDLESRIVRLRREERDLSGRVARQLAWLENGGRWYQSDPLYQRLSSVLNTVRQDLLDAENEALRRASASTPSSLPAAV